MVQLEKIWTDLEVASEYYFDIQLKIVWNIFKILIRKQICYEKPKLSDFNKKIKFPAKC